MLLPFAISLVVLTFVLEIPPILRDLEALIAKGVAWSIVGRALLTLLPQALALPILTPLPQALVITIPMSVLLAILTGFGRLSEHREFARSQACGVPLDRLIQT